MARLAPMSPGDVVISQWELDRLRTTLVRAKVLVGAIEDGRAALAGAHTEFWSGGAAGAYRARVELLASRLAAIEETGHLVVRGAAELLNVLDEVQGL